MATIVKRVLSASTDGVPITVSATVAKLIHTTSSLTTTIDEVFIYASNSSTNSVTINVEINGSASQVISHEVLPKGEGFQLVVPGITFQGQGTSGVAISVQASSSNVINITGFVNRITQ